MKFNRSIAFILILSTLLLIWMPFAFAQERTVESVTQQLQAIDSLQTMQNKRSSFNGTTSKKHYDLSNLTSYKQIHLTAQTGYDTYISNMTAARAAAKQSYEALSEQEQAQIDPALVAKLYDTLETVMETPTFAVTPRNDEYIFESVNGGTSHLGLAYEVSVHMAAGNIPQTFVLVNTSDGKTQWTPDGKYEQGKNNYELTYCCDIETGLEWGSDYRRLNLEDSPYFTNHEAKKIRTIVSTSYPFVSIEEMKQNLKDGGLKAEFVDSLSRSDLITAVQMSIWHYSRQVAPEDAGYYATVSLTPNKNIYFYPLHDFTNEEWIWLPPARTRTFYSDAQYRVNNLISYLCNLEGTEATKEQTVISDIKVGRVDLVPRTQDLYNVGLHITLNNGCDETDNVSLKITSYSQDDEGNKTITNSRTIQIEDENEYTLSVNAKYGDFIDVEAIGTQELEKGVYFYEAEGGAEKSQSLVGVAEGTTPVHAVETFVFERDIDAGLRIYKKSTVDQTPISDITFDVYRTDLTTVEEVNEAPTAEEVAKYAVPENLVGSVTTDVTGYAKLELGHGAYLVVERHNEEKVLAPADPFYIILPWPVEVEVDGEKVIEYQDIVSVYPKNTPIEPPPPPPPPPPSDVYGRFTIIKHDNNDQTDVLQGAKFQIYRAATDEDTETETILCNGLTCAVVPVMVDGEALILTTDQEGRATSPDLEVGVYYIKETKAPTGYVLPKEAKSVTAISKEIAEETFVYIGNDRGIKLPETGGVGTNALIYIGCIVCLGATTAIIVKKRMKRVKGS